MPTALRRRLRQGRPPPALTAALALATPALAALLVSAPAQAQSYPVTPGQRATAQEVAQSGVALSELAPNAPDSHTVKPGDTLWAIAGIFLRSPWRWPELWGMNLNEVRNPHLIYPGQVLVLERAAGRARLRVGRAPLGQPAYTVKLSPRVRDSLLESGVVSAVPLALIGPFLNEAQVLSQDQLAAAPRIVATQEGRVMVSRGELAYVRGDVGEARSFTLFRESRPLKDPASGEVLGYEASYVGQADYVRAPGQGANGVPVPATILLTAARQEAGTGDRLAPMPPRDSAAYAPHAPAAPLDGQIVSLYGDALSAGQNQVVAINRGQRDGVERGHVLALWRAGADAVDRTGVPAQPIRLPDERAGLMFVFRVFERVSYALIVQAVEPIRVGDRFTAP